MHEHDDDWPAVLIVLEPGEQVNVLLVQALAHYDEDEQDHHERDNCKESVEPVGLVAFRAIAIRSFGLVLAVGEALLVRYLFLARLLASLLAGVLAVFLLDLSRVALLIHLAASFQGDNLL